ncbi:MAG: TIGR01210 family radical SAM protein [Candidatus Hydrothermarchaeota archaeon]|nr:MAG: TIGR01210 family radical SAM protein [Candidatus Hydrothermarchaeota archaeon]
MKYMKELNTVMQKIRKKHLKPGKKTRATFWRERDYLHGEVKAGVIILPTRGCRWGRKSGCTMCGYVYDAGNLTQEEIFFEFRKALKELKNIEYLKIFNSGSFFDPLEISKETAEKIFREINKTKIRRLQVESRPEFLTEEILEKAIETLNPELEIGLGVETTNDYIRINCINKNLLLEDYKKAIKLCKSLGIFTKGYLLIKPPFLTEKRAIKDCISSALELYKLGIDRISFNPMNVQRGTLVELLWSKKEYRPPWLWSVVEILSKVKSKIDIPLLSHPTAAGKQRGAHNCGKCDREVYKAIINFSATQNLNYLSLEEIYCECREEWKVILEVEHLNC